MPCVVRTHVAEDTEHLFYARHLLNILKRLKKQRVLMRFASKKGEAWEKSFDALTIKIASVRADFVRTNRLRHLKKGAQQ